MSSLKTAQFRFRPYSRTLQRIVDVRGTGPRGLFILCNPPLVDSVRGPRRGNSALARCESFAARWDWREMHVAYLYALRADNVEEIAYHVGLSPEDNAMVIGGQPADFELVAALAGADVVVAAWGSSLAHRRQSRDTRRRFASRERCVERFASSVGKPLLCLGHSKYGHPKHPMYVPLRTALEVYRGSNGAEEVAKVQAL